MIIFENVDLQTPTINKYYIHTDIHTYIGGSFNESYITWKS